MMGACTGLLWRQHASRGRLLAIGLVGLVVVLLGVAVMVGDGSPAQARSLVEQVGFALLLPVAAVVFGTSVLGDPAEDGTLGYLLTTPQPRWRLTLPALAAATATVVPLAVVPLAAVLVLGGVDARTTLAVVVSGALVATTYTAVFTALGVRYRRALLAGLVYVAIWEGVVANVSTGLARLSVREYALSVVAWLADQPGIAPRGVSGPVAVVVLLGLVVAGGVLTTVLLRTHESRA